MTLRGRAIASNLALIGAITLLFCAMGFAFYIQTVPALETNLQDRTRSTVMALSARLDVPIATGDPARVRHAVQTVLTDSDLAWIRVEDSAGRLLFKHGDVAAEAAEGTAGTVATHKDSYSAWSDVSMEGLVLGRVELGYSRARTAHLERIAVAWIMVVAIVGSIAAAMAMHIADVITLPLMEMIAFTRRVASGDLDARLDVQAPSELQQLADDLNTMTVALASRTSHLLRQREELETSLAQLRVTQQELLESTRLASVGEMAGRAAHEVLNPVTSIHGRVVRIIDDNRHALDSLSILTQIADDWSERYAEAGFDGLCADLRREHEGRPLMEEDLENIGGITRWLRETLATRAGDHAFLLKEIERITHIIDGMRNLTRHSSVAGEHRLLEVVEEAGQVMHDSLAKRGIALQIDVDPGITFVMDRYELIQVLTNLFRNAMQAIEEADKDEPGRIEVTARQADEGVVVTVTDNGTGIEPDNVERIFESSFTTRPPDTGTGLGLSISRRLVRRLHGNLTVGHTEPGVGTTLRIDLPVYRKEGTDAA